MVLAFLLEVKVTMCLETLRKLTISLFAHVSLRYSEGFRCEPEGFSFLGFLETVCFHQQWELEELGQSQTQWTDS